MDCDSAEKEPRQQRRRPTLSTGDVAAVAAASIHRLSLSSKVCSKSRDRNRFFKHFLLVDLKALLSKSPAHCTQLFETWS